MSDTARGFIALVLANLIWGLAPLYYKAFDHVPPLEMLGHRTIWSLVFFGGVLAVQGRLGALKGAVASRRNALIVLLSAVTITINWSLFIWAIQVERALEASLGYYIFPLVTVILGVLVFKEGFGRAKQIAFALAALAVLALTWSVGVAPWVSVVLAVSFGIYSVLKKFSTIGPVVSVTAEVVILAPIALLWLWGVHRYGWTGSDGRHLALFGRDWGTSLALMAAGPLTAGPLVLFSYASRRLSLATVGLTQYMNPTIQLLVAAAIFAEPLTRGHLIAFPLIWLALVIYSADLIRQDRARRRASSSASTPGTV